MKEFTGSLHKAVLLKETIQGLGLKKGARILDATFGGGGHSLYALENFPGTEVTAVDQDAGAWKRAKGKFAGFEKRIFFRNMNFRDIDKLAQGGFDAVILDLGISSDQLNPNPAAGGASGRGFSFMVLSEPLLMTMKENPSPEDLSAMDVLNDWSEQTLADIIYGYGEERYARRIAKGIAEARRKKKIETVGDLVAIIERAVPAGYKRGRTHFATKTFQAIRIAVNDELRALKEGLEKGFQVLKKNGRIAVISFHSLEDRIVKNFYKQKEKESVGKIINKKPLVPGEKERKENPRSRSAKLRILEKI